MQFKPHLRQSKKRGRRAALILTGALLALSVAFVLLLPAIKNAVSIQKAVPADQPSREKTLVENDLTMLDFIMIQPLGADPYTLFYRNGAFFIERDGELTAISESLSEEFLSLCASVHVQDTVSDDPAEVADHLTDMGLEPPRVEASLHWLDGREQRLRLGVNVPETAYYYFCWTGDDAVYMCDYGMADALMTLPNRMLPIEQPVLIKTLIDTLTIEEQGQEPIEMRFDADEGGQISGTLLKPIAYPMDADAADALLNALCGIRLGASEGRVTEENRASGGFDNPLMRLSLTQRAGRQSVVDAAGRLTAAEVKALSLRLVIGRTEGAYYCTCEYEGESYLISRFLLESLLHVTVDELLTRHPASLGDAPLSGIWIQKDGRTLDIQIRRTERVEKNNQLATDENGRTVYDTTATLNGADAAAEAVRALIERLQALTVSGNVPEGWSPDDTQPRWRMTLTAENGETRTLAAYRVDAFSDALTVNGTARHCVYVEALDTALADWSE